jgi:hypothetical protein
MDGRLAVVPDTGPATEDALRIRARIIAISDVLAEHASYFDAEAAI